MTEFAFEDMVWYSVQFLGDLASFLMQPPVFFFVVFGIMFFVVKLLKRMVS